MKNKLTIGQMAKLHHIPIKTLRYYDEIGLFRPMEVDAHSGYRYYATEQFERLNSIQYLKDLGLCLKEIGSMLDYQDIDHFIARMVEQQRITEEKILKLQSIERTIASRIQEVRDAQAIAEIGKVIVRSHGERRIYRLMERFSTEEELELHLRRLDNALNQQGLIFIGKVGLTVSIDNLREHRFQEYNSIFILHEGEGDHELMHILPAGEYATIYYHGNHQASTPYYERLMESIAEQGYAIAGDAIERTIINQYISKNSEDYLTEIQIPIQKA